MFEAGPAGGDAIRVHSGNQVGPASANGIRISGFVDDRHYCSLDWHLIAVDLFDGNLPGESPRTPHEIATALSALAIASYVDGVRLDTVRTPVKPMTDPEGLGLVNGFWFATGRVMAPSDLSVGAHTLRTELTNAGVLVETDQVTFVIDPPGVGACV